MQRPPRVSDTTDRAREVCLNALRAMPVSQKIATVFQLSEVVWQLSEAGVRKIFPEAGDREIFLRTAARHLDRETMVRVYGWDPDH